MSDVDITIKLLAACLCGGLIGFFREKERKAAGLRTHILVCLGSLLFTLISILFSQTYPGVDASRIIANIVVGIGFIGAGTIIRNEGGSIIGITTAASIWVVAGIGISIACGFYSLAGASTFISVLVLHFLHGIEKKFIRGEN